MAKKVLTSFNIIIQAGLDSLPAGFLGFGAKSDGLYQKLGNLEYRLLTDNDLGSLVTTNTSQTISGQKTFSTTTYFNSSLYHRGSLIDSSIVAPLNSGRRQGLCFQNNSSYVNFFINGRDGVEILKLSQTSTQKYLHLPDSDMKVRIGRYGDYLPAHQLVVNGSVLFENTLTVNNAYYFGSSGWSMYYDSRAGGIVFVQNGTVRFTINSSGGVSRI